MASFDEHNALTPDVLKYLLIYYPIQGATVPLSEYRGFVIWRHDNQGNACKIMSCSGDITRCHHTPE